MKTIKVDFGEASYPLFIGNDVLDRFGEILSLYRFPDTVIIIYKTVPALNSFHPVNHFLKLNFQKVFNRMTFRRLRNFSLLFHWRNWNQV